MVARIRIVQAVLVEGLLNRRRPRPATEEAGEAEPLTVHARGVPDRPCSSDARAHVHLQFT